MKVRIIRLIAKLINDQPHPIIIQYDKYKIRPNAPIIIILIKKIRATKIGELIVNIKR